MFFVIEGLDGVGKTTIGRMLAKELNANLIKTPPQIFKFFHKFFQKRTPSKSSLIFYLFSVFVVSLRIIFTNNKKSFICVRYLDSTIAYHAAFNYKFQVDRYCWLFKKPDFIIYLIVNENVRKNRLSDRNKLSKIDLLSQDQDICNSIKHHYNNNMISNIHIDTTEKSVHIIIKIILKKIKTNKNN